ncbi:TVP38/TMEM64 family protein [Clostridium scatologenes]|uniref:TVP38/TMEM64 family membrane protein n=1 Tax=Clostridium scatologenes TaxID=1548 RepID=A0A0E3GRV7_CLOSL|nr:TVP38/TMEM64 family protein [Clostridium scatologenes]AKA70991.1 SNARE associated Golgi protein [Clostridium scatologenes]
MKENKKKILQYFIGALLIIVFVYFMMKYGKRLTHLRIKHVRHYILSYGKFASIAFILLYSLKPVALIVPVSLLSIVAGNVFGPYKALLLSMIGCFTSGTLAFFLARFLGRSFVDKLLKGKAMKLDSSIEKHGTEIMCIMRLSFIFPYDPLSYAAGLTKMKYRSFILGTMIGVFPEMVSYSFIGKSLEHPFSIKFFIPIIFIVVVAVIALGIYKSSKKTKSL